MHTIQQVITFLESRSRSCQERMDRIPNSSGNINSSLTACAAGMYLGEKHLAEEVLAMLKDVIKTELPPDVNRPKNMSAPGAEFS